MRVVAVEIRPAVGRARNRDKVDALKRDEVGKRRPGEVARGVVQRYVPRDHETVELKIHRKRIAFNRGAVARAHADVPVGLHQEPIVVERDVVGVEVQERLRARAAHA